MSTPTLREVEPDDYASWFEANRATLAGRSPFHDPAWLQASARGIGFRTGFIGAYADRELTAVVPGYVARRGPFRLFGSPLRGTMTSYLGPVGLDEALVADERRELIGAAADFARRRWRARYVRFTVRDAPAIPIAPPGPGWHQQRPPSYRLDLSPGEDAVFSALKSSCRRNVRKAAREGVEIVPFHDARGFHAILQDTFRRHASTSWHPPRFFESIIEALEPRGLLRGWGARYDGRIIAAGLFLHDEREMHFLSGASVAGYGNLPTSYLLHWHAIAQAIRAGVGVFNSEASGIRSIDDFKETFNPVLERRGTLLRAPRPIWTAQKAFLRWNKGVRRLRSRMATG
jgi:Acetyltransferase (GNAT) domain